jgi:hypothetical protein
MMRKLVREATVLEQTARTLREFASGSGPQKSKPKRKNGELDGIEEIAPGGVVLGPGHS